MAMTELEQRLASPDGVAVRDDLARQLAALEERLRARLAASLPPAQYADAAALAEAARAAQEVLARWPVGQGAPERPPLESLFTTLRSTPCP